MIELTNVQKRYGQIQGLAPCTLTVATQEIILLAGSDGAGKTTFLKLLGHLLKPDTGTIRIDGLTPQEQIRHIGYCAQEFSWYTTLTVEENILLAARLYGLSFREAKERSQTILSFVGLYPYRDRLAAKLSGGMKKKTALAAALIHHPRYLLLDEPSTGIDPVSRQELWELFQTLQRQGTTLVIASPYFTEAAYCHAVVLLHEGHILYQGRRSATDLEKLFFTLTEE